MPLPKAVLAIAAGLVAASGCGGGSSAADHTKTDACNAKSDINTQVQKLKGLPPTLSSVDTAKTALTKIEDDLSTIKDSAPKVDGDLKGQLQSANSQFEAQVKQISQSITSAQSLTAAATAITQAGDQLAADYQKAFANVSC
jgi:chromosome segregation ATPase